MKTYPEAVANRWRKQAEPIPTLSALEIGLSETLDILRSHMVALEILAKELRECQKGS